MPSHNAVDELGMTELNGLTGTIIQASLQVHRDLGPGLLESVYETVLCSMLTARSLRVRRQHAVRFQYDGVTFENAFRVDLLVEDCVVVEIKSVARIEPVFRAQLLTYIRLMNMPLGLLINFGAPTLKEGLKRVINRRL